MEAEQAQTVKIDELVQMDFSRLTNLATRLSEFSQSLTDAVRIMSAVSSAGQDLQHAQEQLADTQAKLQQVRAEHAAEVQQANQQRTQAQIDLQALAAEIAAKQAVLDSIEAKKAGLRASLAS